MQKQFFPVVNKILRKCVMIILFVCVILETVCGQDANYWSSAYGPGSFFTPGSVISYNRDSGVFFYNPALLAYSNRSAASISSTVYDYRTTKIKNGAGEKFDLNAGGVAIIPLIASHTIPLKLKRPVTIVYGIFNRPVMGFQASKRSEKLMNVLDDSYSPGDELYIGQFTTTNLATEINAIISAGTHLSERFTAGISMEAKINRHHAMVHSQARALQNLTDSTIFPPVVSVENFYEVNARNIGIRFKLGADYKLGTNHHLGLIVSFPLIRISGKGSILADIEINDLALVPGVPPLSLLASTFQPDLKSNWKMPLSIGAGYTWFHKKGMLYLAAEYFAKIKEYNVVAPDQTSFIRPDTLDQTYVYDLLRYKDARKPLANAAIGFSYQLRKNITGYLSFRTDFNYLDMKTLGTDGFIAATSRWNNYHTQLGANVQLKKMNIRAGFIFSYGKTSEYPQYINFNNPDESNLLNGELTNTTAIHIQTGLMVSYLYSF